MTKETRQFKTYETQQKQFSEGSLQQYNPTSRNKKKSQINNVTLHLKQLEKEEQKTPKVSRRNEIIKVRSEINEKEMKEMIEKINKLESGSLRR